ncbi:N-acetyl-gamma-glutamyl-phosphate reductase [Geodia barretti]|uniref:N-acetyl-gamma-glutamyl-phosphate reductase n=1 Tax=Geodia barretti TaxID=519541 RepID=A0AA35RAF9_GEOBA|nr:N-acetyl-gamma-glutamyl-phosphate reductase [Geodia barretti]
MSHPSSGTGNTARVGVLGASGYTGGELLRLLASHDGFSVGLLTAERRAGQSLGAVFPHLGGAGFPDLVKIEDAAWDALDAVFCCLPHGTTQEVVAALPGHLKVVDLSADFRLADPEVYAECSHATTVRGARLVANPGCYPTASQLPLAPLLEDGLIESEDIIIDAKSGVSGAGREAKQGSLFAEVGEGVHAYGVAHHRHAPEIEQGLSAAAGTPIRVNFTPHLIPMNRGILATIYVRSRAGADALREALARRYADEPFVRVLPAGAAPATRHVRGSNHCLIGVFDDRIEGRAILISAIDNLVKGASGQAIQNMNLMHALPETTGLEQAPLFPRGSGAYVAPNAFVAAGSSVIGDVVLGAQSSVWFNCVLRGDVNYIRVGARSNVQDGTIIHTATADGPTLIGEDVVVGHMCLLHACVLEDGCMIGMGATVMDYAVVETGAWVAAGALVTPGKRHRPALR